MDRRKLILTMGFGMAAAALPLPTAQADRVHPPAAPPDAQSSGFVFRDEFDGPAGSAPDGSKWVAAKFRERIKNPVFWDRPENMGEYRDSRTNIFLDGNSNLVIRAAKEGNKYFSGKLHGTFRGGMGHTFEARIKFNCLTDGCWPAWWLLNDNPERGGEIDMAEWYGNRDWPSGTTVHARLDGTSFETLPVPIDSNWHTWRCTWTEAGLYFWMDYHDGMEPYLTVDANSLDDWPFNDPGYTLQPMLNLAVAGSGGGDPAGGSYPAEMLVDYVRVW